MRKFAFLSIFVFCLVKTDYAQVARHFWLNDSSYNHTLYPTSDGGYVLAAARQQLGASVRNTITVFKLDAGYNIVDSRSIGLPGGLDGFDDIVYFEVHDITENDHGYIICGSIRDPIGSDPPGIGLIGMVTIIDFRLNVHSIRQYQDVITFYSVYAEGDYFYTCGLAKNGHGIVMRDDIFTMHPQAYITREPWVYHKIKENNGGMDIVVSGNDDNEIGFTAFNTGGFSPIGNASSKFYQPSNSKTVVTNDPRNSYGFILSTSYDFSIYTYLFNDYQTMQHSVYEIHSTYNGGIPQLFLEDMNTSPTNIAWVGNQWMTDEYDSLNAFYISLDIAFQHQTRYISYYTQIQPFPFKERYFLYKIHYNPYDQTFHCGGFYSYINKDKAIFVVAPELAINNNCGEEKSLYVRQHQTPYLQHLSIDEVEISVKEQEWYAAQYNFCTVNCESTQLNNYINNSCGNQ